MRAISALAVVFALVFTIGCAPNVNDPADVQAVTETVAAFGKAAVQAVKRDIPAIERHLGKEWMVTNDGQVVSRAQLLAELKSGTYSIESLVFRDLSVHVFGDVVLAGVGRHERQFVHDRARGQEPIGGIGVARETTSLMPRL